ncbi:MAG: type II/IV secretion system ATPase subunit [Candidatus Diapherotrites archaeon]|nr:type II/IV secretion system ATPase subunit [Candidatus Diapherotrites archaeon]
MKIGGFEVGDWAVKEEAGKRNLIFACRDCIYSANVVTDQACRFHVLKILSEVQADITVLSEVYERVYDELQTQQLSEVGQLLNKFAIESVWATNNLGNPLGKADEAYLSNRYRIVVTIAQDLLAFDPIRAYITCLQELLREQGRFDKGNEEYKKGSSVFLKTLNYLRTEFEKTLMIKTAKKFLTQLKEVPDTKEIYQTMLEAEVKPSFIGSRLLFEEAEELELLDEYSVGKTSVQIFRHPLRTESLYFINPPEYSLSPEKYFVLSKTREIVAGYKPGKSSLSALSKARTYFERIYQSTIADVALQNNIKLEKDEVKELSAIVARYSIGYGILEILLSDRRLTDIYIDSPIGQNPIYAVHSDYGQVKTNILYTEGEAQSMVTKLRAMSARPFDEAHPVLDFDLPDLDTRVATIGPPLATDGVAFAFRLHKLTPWTLSQFIDVKYLNSTAAGLISFFIDNQLTIIVAGSRGSGKTSLLGANLLEIPKNTRILIQEDTLELPVPYMKKIGFNVQRLKTQSAIGGAASEIEMPADEALRTTLRLGNSAIILGEVRSKEAKTLYEAMRVGSAGGIVMGTLHADSAYSVWDRVVNDLEVPNTSFKATDLIMVARPIRFSGSLKSARRIVQITEVKKHWVDDPEREEGLLDLMSYDAKKDSLELMEDNLKESELFERVRKMSGLNFDEIWAEIKMRGESKQYLVDLKREKKLPQLLEAEYTSLANDKWLLLKEKFLEENTKLDHAEILGEWKNWVNTSLLKRVTGSIKPEKGKE